MKAIARLMLFLRPASDNAPWTHTGAILELDADEVSIGRELRIIVIHDNEVSCEHRRPRAAVEGYELHDLQSSNGTSSTGVMSSPRMLTLGTKRSNSAT
ncbi:MAG: hypothetical protein IPK17_39375 [Chloroflexi bacterium]|uniref:hypothetical protein n=1 Tax=Candidatus Flexifilum breve TaxID=3140694 RepID=UPI00313493DE|nr:hypothetical protein [Chloroflexota bacterium]